MSPTTRLLLVGAGHAHLEVVRRSPELAAAGYAVTLVAPPTFSYSGMASATAAGDLPATRSRVDVAALARRSGVVHHAGTVVALDLPGRVATTDDGTLLGYDVVSVNVGSAVAEGGLAVDDDVLRAKPLDGLHALADRLAAAPPTGLQVTVVGGGATGLELAAHLAARPEVRRVTLLERGGTVGLDLPRGARRSVARVLDRRGVVVRTGCAVASLHADVAVLADGGRLEHDLAVLATGLVPSPAVERLGLGGPRGVPVRATLQHRDHDEVHAVGDCADFLPRRLPSLGVHGVRQAPVLVESLLARRSGAPLPTYRPQREALAILDLGRGEGLATRGRLWWHGRAALRWKRRIDARWLERYSAPRGGDASGRSRSPHGMDERTATIGDVPVRWLEQDGQGVPVVLVHGIPTSPALWRHVVPRLAGLRVLALEMTGYGESIPAGEGRDLSLSAQADLLLTWLDHLGIDRAVLVGHDLGGGVVHIAAVRRPETCAGLLVTNGVGYDSWPIPEVKAMARARRLLARVPASALKPGLGLLVAQGHDDRDVAKESLPVHHAPYARHGGGRALARQVAWLEVEDTLAVADRLPTLRVPARVVWGTADRFQKVEYGERFARDLGVPLRRIEGGKHFTPEDHPDVLAEEVRGLVAEIEEADRGPA